MFSWLRKMSVTASLQTGLIRSKTASHIHTYSYFTSFYTYIHVSANTLTNKHTSSHTCRFLLFSWHIYLKIPESGKVWLLCEYTLKAVALCVCVCTTQFSPDLGAVLAVVERVKIRRSLFSKPTTKAGKVGLCSSLVAEGVDCSGSLSCNSASSIVDTSSNLL